MQTKLLFMTIGFLAFALAGFSASRSYTYIDGNNNNYTITADSLIYKPIKPIESSSGTYSGGDPKSVVLSSEQFSKIEAILKTIQKDKGAHESSRQMGFGTLIIGKKSIFLNSNYEGKKTLEQLLKDYLG